MIQTRTKHGNEIINNYGPEDDWKIEQDDSARWVLYAKQISDSTWTIINRCRTEEAATKAHARQLSDYEWTLAHPNTSEYELLN